MGYNLRFFRLHTGIDQWDGEWRAIFGDWVNRFSKHLWMGGFQLVQKLLRALKLCLVCLSTVG